MKHEENRKTSNRGQSAAVLAPSPTRKTGTQVQDGNGQRHQQQPATINSIQMAAATPSNRFVTTPTPTASTTNKPRRGETVSRPWPLEGRLDRGVAGFPGLTDSPGHAPPTLTVRGNGPWGAAAKRMGVAAAATLIETVTVAFGDKGTRSRNGRRKTWLVVGGFVLYRLAASGVNGVCSNGREQEIREPKYSFCREQEM